MIHKYTKYDRRESTIFSSDRQFPRKGGFVKVNGPSFVEEINNKLTVVKQQIGSDFNKDKNVCLVRSPGEDKPLHLVLRLRGGASDYDDDNGSLDDAPSEVVCTYASVNSLLKTTGWMREVNEIKKKLVAVRLVVLDADAICPNLASLPPEPS